MPKISRIASWRFLKAIGKLLGNTQRKFLPIGHMFLPAGVMKNLGSYCYVHSITTCQIYNTVLPNPISHCTPRQTVGSALLSGYSAYSLGSPLSIQQLLAKVWQFPSLLWSMAFMLKKHWTIFNTLRGFSSSCFLSHRTALNLVRLSL